MSKEHSVTKDVTTEEASNNASSDDDVAYVFYRGVRTAVRKPTLQTPTSTSSMVAEVKENPIQIKKISPSAAKPWLDDAIILPTHPGSNQSLKSKADTAKTPETETHSSQSSTHIAQKKAPLIDDALIPAIAAPAVANNTAAKTTADETTESAETTPRALNISLRQRPQLLLPQLRSSLQLPPLFAAGEVVKEKAESIAPLASLTAESLLSEDKVASASQQLSTQTSTQAKPEGVTNEMLLQEIGQLRLEMMKMQQMLHDLQNQLQTSKTPSPTEI